MKTLLTVLVLSISSNLIVSAQNHSLYFDGNSYVDCGKVGVVKGDELTIELWIKPEDPNDWIGTFLHKGYESSTNYQLNLLKDTRQVQFRFHGDNNAWNGWKSYSGQGKIDWSWQATGPNFSWDHWMHLAIVFRSGTPAEVYINGSSEGHGFFREAGVNDAHLVDYDSSLILGQSNIYAGAQRTFKGCMDEVRIWNRALDQNEIIAKMEREIDLNNLDDTNGLQAYYRFNFDQVIDLISENEGTVYGTIQCSDSPQIVQQADDPPEDHGGHSDDQQPSFEDVDENGDGVIEREEARNFFGDEPDFDTHFNELAGEDGVVDKVEYASAEENDQKSEDHGGHSDDQQPSFEDVDENGDGVIEREEG